MAKAAHVKLKVIHLKPMYFRCMAAILDYQKEHQGYPSIRELQSILNLSSTSVVEWRMRYLERKGVLKVIGTRAMKITCDMIVLDIDYGA